MDRILPLMQREWLQNRRSWALLAAIPLAILLLLSAFGQVQLDEETRQKIGEALPLLLAFASIGITMLITFGIVWFSALVSVSALPRRDHGDRSIEFWLSMPLSHSASLAVPMGVHLLLVPAAGLMVGLVGGCAVSLLLVNHVIGTSAWLALPWGQLLPAAVMLSLRFLFGLVLATMWLSPFILLFMLMTAWFRRWGWVVTAGLGLGVTVLKHVFGMPLLSDWSAALFKHAGHALVNLGEQGYHLEGPGDVLNAIGLVPAWVVEDVGRALRDLASPLLVGGLLLSAGMFAVLVQWRQRGASAAG